MNTKAFTVLLEQRLAALIKVLTHCRDLPCMDGGSMADLLDAVITPEYTCIGSSTYTQVNAYRGSKARAYVNDDDGSVLIVPWEFGGCAGCDKLAALVHVDRSPAGITRHVGNTLTHAHNMHHYTSIPAALRGLQEKKEACASPALGDRTGELNSVAQMLSIVAGYTPAPSGASTQ